MVYNDGILQQPPTSALRWGFFFGFLNIYIKILTIMKLRNIISKNINEYLFEAQKIKTNINDNFWKWFGDSKIIENGEPISVYHQNVSGDNNFNEFIPQSFGTFGQNSMFYFAKDKNWVKNFVKTFNNSNKEKPRVFYLSIQNPLNLQNLLLTPKEWVSFLENKNLLTNTIKDSLNNMPNWAYGGFNKIPSWKIYRYDFGEFVDKLKENGYDGVIQTDANYGRTNDLTTYVAIKPNQIKSVKNDGSWDINDDNIYS
jgi:hypothetical protein